jgi:hypothetical protein
MPHSPKRGASTHPVQISSGSRRYDLPQPPCPSANTRRLQAVRRLGAGYRAVATAPTGLWKPSSTRTAGFLASAFTRNEGEPACPLFRGLVDQASRSGPPLHETADSSETRYRVRPRRHPRTNRRGPAGGGRPLPGSSRLSSPSRLVRPVGSDAAPGTHGSRRSRRSLAPHLRCFLPWTVRRRLLLTPPHLATRRPQRPARRRRGSPPRPALAGCALEPPSR